MAGEIVAIGEEVKGWKQGNRVCANFTIDHIYGDLNPAIQRTALGGAIHGVLTEYRIFPAHVCTGTASLKVEITDTSSPVAHRST